MEVRDGMTRLVLTVGPAHTLREASHQMSARHVGAAVVTDPEHAGIGILTERDVLDSVGAGQDPDAEVVADHRTGDVVFASPEWTLQQAAATMVQGGFRHLVVVEDHEVVGLLSMRDIVRCWSAAGATVPAASSATVPAASSATVPAASSATVPAASSATAADATSPPGSEHAAARA